MTNEALSDRLSHQKTLLAGLLDELHDKDLEIVGLFSAVTRSLICGRPKAASLSRRIERGALLQAISVETDQVRDLLSDKQARRLEHLLRRYAGLRADCLALTVAFAREGNVPTARFRRLAQDLVELVGFLEDLKSEVWDLYAATDTLTGLLNRTALDAIAAEELRRAKRTGQPLCLALVDVDRFKAINDRHGHQAGDTVLAELSQRIYEGVRASDHVVRYGGEEILLLLPQTRRRQALRLLERIRTLVAELPLGIAGTDALHATVSIGFTELAPGAAFDAALRVADEALYAAKAEGRNCIRFRPAGAGSRPAGRRGPGGDAAVYQSLSAPA